MLIKKVKNKELFNMHVINDKITKFGDINIKDIKISKNDASELKLIFKNKKPNVSFNKIH